jgi:plastocyanin
MLHFFFGAGVDRQISTSTLTPRRRPDRLRKRVRPVVEPLEGRALLATTTVNIVGVGFQGSFNPDPVPIHVGDTVHWVWQTSDHSTTSVGGIPEHWDSGVQNAGFTFDHTFTHTGSFQYYCTVHGQDNGNGTASGMHGTIMVMPATGVTLSSIAVTPANPTVGVGSTQAFTATGTFSDNSTQNITSQVTWASATTSVATITSTGVATGVAPGTSVITASLNGVTGMTHLTVSGSTSPTPTLSSEMRMFVGKGAKRKLIAFDLVFSSALDMTNAQDATHYQIVQPGKTKKSHPVAVPVQMAMYFPTTDTVMLMIGKANAKKPFTLTATGLTSAAGTPLATIMTNL